MFATVEIMDIETGRAETLFETDAHVEAPNWLPDGTALLVNADGRLYRVPLDAPALEPVDMHGFHQGNNDHGPAPDGRAIAFSDKTETGKSCIYVMEEGSAPRRVTAEVPSWFHGWSPDGALVVYPCVRDGQFGIATTPAAGGPETLLISGPGHYDGPDFTPDGKHIWFNSDRGGAMALWRMRADGSAPEQMTDGARVDWFPHPSPDGAHVVYLSYPPGTEGHPFGCDVELRLMPADGGAPRTLAAFYGGQGTLNVPSWAPDARRFAYVRYARPG